MEFVKPHAPAELDAARTTLAELYREYADSVARWASRLAGPALEVEDLVQEVFFVAQRQLPSFRGESNVRTWLYGITQNVVRYRRRKERLRRILLGWVRDEAVSQDAYLAVKRPTAVEELERREATVLVYRVLDGFAEKYRTVFILHELEGLAPMEIASLIRQNPATVRVRLHRARALFTEGVARMEKRDRRRSDQQRSTDETTP